MRKNRMIIAGATLLAATMAMSACGTRAEEGGGGGGGGEGGGGAETKTAVIGVVAPLSGPLAPLGLGIQHSVELAVQQANESGAIPGWELEVQAEDDQGQPDPGRNAATSLSSDSDVVGMVGPLNSSVGQAIQPVFDAASIVQVSPANTSPALTRGAEFDTAPERPYETYFRTCTTDAVQGPFAAQYLYETAGITKVATIHDKKAYGQGLVEAFAAEFESLGGEVVAAETINPDDTNFSAVISAVSSGEPDAVYYGGEYPQSGPLSQQMKAAGLDVPLMGGDGMYDPTYVELAGDGSEGDLATSVGAPTEDLESAQEFVAAYEAANFADPYAAYGPYAYDAAQAVIEALKVSLPEAETAEDARQATVDAMASVSFSGASGEVAFDEFGDATTRVLTVYEVTDGAWAPLVTDEFQG
ncbi:branched-chain amino acid ABC transporter substrate-binding protein [Auraticoccus monumenti]|uniref:Branched-chain amino acid transport system substrate-binding protein n=1 Tax=Auraticoccus monumenti TaxID=675864 RepID=A0A1G7DLU3_9ACTN|nr:branched-chain amino acid ABC transporter substrate-binding protein [Auraticoccus monumenti]SDE52086.1 branched-chain amino acid transport system substrate-binding protein [Auraticoccus monumenti]